MTQTKPTPVVLDEKLERARRQRSRSVAIALALGAMSVLFYAATIVRMGGNALNRPLVITGSVLR